MRCGRGLYKTDSLWRPPGFDPNSIPTTIEMGLAVGMRREVRGLRAAAEAGDAEACASLTKAIEDKARTRFWI